MLTPKRLRQQSSRHLDPVVSCKTLRVYLRIVRLRPVAVKVDLSSSLMNIRRKPGCDATHVSFNPLSVLSFIVAELSRFFFNPLPVTMLAKIFHASNPRAVTSFDITVIELRPHTREDAKREPYRLLAAHRPNKS